MRKNIIRPTADIGFIACDCVAGKLEHDGPLGARLPKYCEDDRFGCDTWEKSESEMQRLALEGAFEKCGLARSDVSALFAGDLLNQCVGSAYGLKDFDIPYFGLYGACSTAVEGLLLASVFASQRDSGAVAVVTSSHNCASERQYRTPVEYGAQRTPTAQWTVTGAGAFIIGRNPADGIYISEGIAGIVCDPGINDAANMGTAMAPAAADTLLRYFSESGSKPDDFDLIVTGDLGHVGSDILRELMKKEGCDISRRHTDAGILIYSKEVQDTHAGGSGCGCSALVLGSYILPEMAAGRFSDVILVGTGAMMNPSSINQGLNIPGIGHLIVLRTRKNA